MLGQFLGEVGKRVDVTGLRALPSRYVESVASVPTLAPLASLFRSTASAEAILARVDEVTVAIGHHYLLWVDDLERFAGESKERLGAITALLYRLDALRRCTVIVATTDLEYRVDRAKIARYVVEVPKISANQAPPRRGGPACSRKN